MTGDYSKQAENFKGAKGGLRADGALGKRRGRKKGQCIGVYSLNTTLANLDLRSREARLIRGVRKELTEHIGGKPNPVQRMLIERCAMLTLRVAMLDEKIIAGEILTTMDNNQYLAWSNSLSRTLAQLGLTPATPSAPSLNDVLRDISSRRRAEPDEEDDEAAA